jgi:hypothetical protein
MRKSLECHSEPQAKNLAFPATYEGEILRLSPQDDIVTQSAMGEGRVKIFGYAGRSNQTVRCVDSEASLWLACLQDHLGQEWKPWRTR